MKRHESIQPLSREHHQGLLLCWKIRTGISKGVDIAKIKTYSDWYYTKYIIPHFEAEEKHVFPLLGKDHPLVQKALNQHVTLRKLFAEQSDVESNLLRISEELDYHIRLEERELFPEIQAKISEEALRALDEVHNEITFEENVENMFWI